jgi:hypothetical protein
LRRCCAGVRRMNSRLDLSVHSWTFKWANWPRVTLRSLHETIDARTAGEHVD